VATQTTTSQNAGNSIPSWRQNVTKAKEEERWKVTTGATTEGRQG
jgi:hypothetical protein